MFLGFQGAQIVMGVIALIAFLMIVFVVYLGTKDNEEHPTAASESHAVQAWRQRLEAANQSKSADASTEAASEA